MAAGLSSFVAAYRARAFLAVALAATAAYAVNSDANEQALIAIGICSASAVVLALRMRFAPVRRDIALWLPLAGQVVLLASFAASRGGFLSNGPVMRSVADFLVLVYFVCVIAVAMILACRRDGSTWATLDAVMIASGICLLSLPVIDQLIEDNALSVTTTGTLILFTIACVLLLASMLRLVVTPGRRDTVLWLVAAACGALIAGALAWDFLSLAGSRGRPVFEVGLLLSAAFAGTAALARSDPARTRRPSGVLTDRRGPVALILGALLIAPAMVGAVIVTHAGWTMAVIVGAGATVMALLLAARLVVLLDRSEQLALELSRHNRELAERALIVQSTDHAVFSADPEGVITSWNPAAERLYGYSSAEAIGRSIIALTAPVGGEAQLESHRVRLKRGETLSGLHTKRRRKDGSLFDVVLSISPARDEAGNVIAFLTVARDETDERNLARERDELHKAAQVATEQLAEQVRRMQELDRMKDDFVASVSHELRTPLTSIGGYLDLVLDRDADELTDEQRHFLEVVDRNSQRLLRLVNDLLDVAHLGAGNLILESVECDAVGLVAECVERAEAVARDRDVVLRLDARTDARLEADPMRLGQVVDNLLSNALKFTAAGGSVDVRVLDIQNGVAIEVADTGMGMSPGVQERLFERFYRAPEAAEQAIQGTGLGLWITKKIVVAHGGTIGVESVDGRGSTFRIELPGLPLAGAEAAA